MYRRSHYLILIIFTSLIWGCLRGQIYLGIRGCNNNLSNRWIITAAPEISISSNWFLISADGTMRSYPPISGNGGYILHTRFSIIPMLRLKLFGPFFLSTGYGASYCFHREVTRDINNQWHIFSNEKIQGELRGILGVEIPFSASLKVLLKGGASFINKDHKYFSIGVGTLLLLPRVKHEKAGDQVNVLSGDLEEIQATSNKNVDLTDIDKIIKNEEPQKSISRVTIIKNENLVEEELNTAIKISLINSGIKVINWNKIYDSLYVKYEEESLNKSSSKTYTSIDQISKMDIAMRGAPMFNLDAIIATKVRFSYKSYGEKLIVHSVSIRMIDPTSGSLLWADLIEDSKKNFTYYKKEISRKLIEAIKKVTK